VALAPSREYTDRGYPDRAACRLRNAGDEHAAAAVGERCEERDLIRVVEALVNEI
jgi:hypothetical protein